MDTLTPALQPESVGESLSRAWVAVKANIWLFAGFLLLFSIAYFVVAVIPLINIGAYLFSFILPVSMYTAFEAADGGREIRFSDFFAWTPQTSRLLVGALIMIAITIAFFIPVLLAFLFFGFSIPTSASAGSAFATTGLVAVGILCLIFGFVLGVFSFSLSFLLLTTDKSMGETLRLSWKTGWQNLGGIILWALLAIGLYFIGMIALIIGVLVTMPLIFGTRYFFLRSRFPGTAENWDLETHPPSDPYRLS